MELMLYIPLNRIVHLRGYKNIGIVIFVYFHIWVISPGWGTICDGVKCYIRKCTIYYP